jgi:arsenic resistance protein ArsH
MNLFRHTLRVRTFTNNLHASAPFHALLQRRCFSDSILVKQARNLSQAMDKHGDLNNSHAGRTAVKLAADPAYSYQSLAIKLNDDDVEIREQYRPFLLDNNPSTDDWISGLELSTAIQMVQSEILDKGLNRLRILVLYGSLRSR